MTIKIEAVKKTQIEALRQIVETTFLDTFAHLNVPENIAIYSAQAFTPTQIQNEFNNKNSFFFFIYDDDEVAGYLKLNIEDAQTESDLDNAVEIERIYIIRSLQGRGLGKTLFEFSLQFANDRSAAWLWLGVWDQNAKAIDFYKRLGFREFSQHAFNLGKERQTDILMKMRL